MHKKFLPIPKRLCMRNSLDHDSRLLEERQDL